MKLERAGALLLMGGLLVVGIGCGQKVDSFETSAVEIRWSVLPLGCDFAELDSVVAELENERYTHERSADCSAGAVSIDGVEPGRYEVKLRGKTQEQAVTYGADLEGLSVRPGVVNDAGEMELEALPGSAEVRWEFAETTDCESAGVNRVEITAYDESHRQVGRIEQVCGLGSTKMGDLGSGEMLFLGRARGENRSYEGISKAHLKRGQDRVVTVELGSVDEPDELE